LKSKFEIFLDTDIFLNHLHEDSGKAKSLLLKCLRIFDGCYTSVINAAEIFSGCTSPEMTENSKHAFYGVGVLGIPYKYSLRIGEVMKHVKKKIWKII
jgi:predicted nucleic acid-binding protein